MTTISDLEHVGTETFDAMSSGARYVAPKAVGFFGRVFSFGARGVAYVAPTLEAEAVALVPGGGEIALAWRIATNPLTHVAAGCVAVLIAYGVGHHRGYEEEVAKVHVADAVAERDRQAKDAANEAQARGAATAANARIAADKAKIDRLNARIAASKPTRLCPPILLDTIRGLGK